MDFVLFIIAFLDFIAGRKVRSIFIAIVLASNAFDTIKAVSFPVQHEMGDLGLILFIIMWFLYPRIYREKIPTFGLLNVLSIFGVFLFISVLIDMFVNGTGPKEILLTNRRFWLFIAAYSLSVLNKDEINLLLKAIIVANLVILILSALQYLGLVDVLSYNFKYDISSSNKNSTYGFYAPLSLMPATLLLISQKGKDYFNNNRGVLLAFCVVGILMTVIRSYIISFGAATIIVLFSGQKLDFRKIGIIIVLILLVLIGFTYLPQLSKRFSLANDAMETGSMAFRSGLVDSAMKYVGSRLKNIIFGLGWEYLDFNHSFSWTQRQWILSTPDTSWPPMLGRLGFGGAIIFLMIYMTLIKTAIEERHNVMSIVLLGMIVHLILISFAGTSFIQGKYIMIPYIFYFYLQREKEQRLDNVHWNLS